MHGPTQIPWEDAELLLAIAEAGSLSGAAKRLKITQPTASRRLAELEARIREPLFERSVSGVSLTSLGEQLLEPARRMADAARDLARIAARADTQERGVVRVTAPPGIAYDLLAPFSALLREHLPEVSLQVISSVSYLDLARREADLGIRFESPARSGAGHDLKVLATAEQGVAAYATRQYIARLPKGYGIRDVDWVGWAPPLDNVPPNPQLAALIPGFRPVFASDDFLVQFRAAESGVGAIMLGRLRSRIGLPSPLVPLDLDLGRRSSKLHLVCAPNVLSVPRVRAVADLLAQELGAMGPVSTERRGRNSTARSS